jgi:hypothetical protein
MSRTVKRNPLKAWGMRLARRSSAKNACVAVSRRLAGNATGSRVLTIMLAEEV